jgi:hypothetical protein
MALIHEMRAAQAALSADEGAPNPKNTNVFFVTMSRQNVSALLKAIQRLEHYWAGASSVASILEKRESPGPGFKRVLTCRIRHLTLNAPSAPLNSHFAA